MRLSAVAATAVVALLLSGCTAGDGTAPEPTGATVGTAVATTDATTSASPSPSPSPSPSRSPLGSGTVTVDDVELPVSGDCDISKDFGQQPVRGVSDEDLDVLLAVDNLTSTGRYVGPFPLRVRLLGSGALEGRTITSVERADEGGEVTWEGPVSSASLRDREELEFRDVATLHLEATQEAVGPGAPSGTRELVLDVTCAIIRPG